MKTFFDKLFNWIDTRRGAVGGSIVGKLWKKFGYILLICYTVLLSVFSFVRIFDNDFWGDECYSLRLLTLPFAEMIQETALDVHPPLYYIILRIFANVLGMKGWVFHLASFVPYVGILILALTYVYRKMGQWTTLLLVTACSLTKCAVIYNVEVRNYAWAAFFVLASFLALHSMLEHRTKCNSAWFILASLGAAYTHYYALISVAFFYVVLLLFSLTGDDKKKKIIQTLWVYGITIVGYLPWFVVLLQTFSRTSEGYWMTEYPGFWTCLQYVFLSHFDWEMTIGVICFFVFGLLAAGFVFGREREERRVVLYTLAAGYVCLLGTILTGITVSAAIRPMFIEKYIFPACLVAWVSLGYAISQLRLKEVYAMGIAALIGMAGIPTYKNVYFADRDGQKALERTLAYTCEVFTEDTLLLTDNSHESWTILEYYYPKATSQYIWPEADFEAIDYMSQNYLLLKAPIDAYYTEVFTNAGFAIREFMPDGHIGTHRLYIYELVTE